MNDTTGMGNVAAGGIAPVAPGDVVAGKYRVEHVIQQGGMGVVVAALDTTLARRAAIKFLLRRLASSEAAGERFRHEGRWTSALTSEHVVTVYETGTLPSGEPFIAMEYLGGRDLARLLSDQGPLDQQRAVDYLLQALEAIAQAHAQGLVHRDLKPSNLFVTERDGGELIKVLDFGIAKWREAEELESLRLTASGDVQLGSPAYSSPEQLRDPRDVDERSDIWSLGVTLYELIAGRSPFTGPTRVALSQQIEAGKYLPLSEAKPELALPAGLTSAIERCLCVDRAQRFASAADLARALAPYGTEEASRSLKSILRSFQPPPSPRGAGARSEPAAECELTLVAPLGHSASRSDPGTHGGTADVDTRAASPARPLRRAWLVAIAVFVLGLIGWLSRHPRPGVQDSRAPVDPPKPAPSAAAPVSADPVDSGGRSPNPSPSAGTIARSPGMRIAPPSPQLRPNPSHPQRPAPAPATSVPSSPPSMKPPASAPEPASPEGPETASGSANPLDDAREEAPTMTASGIDKRVRGALEGDRH